MDQLSGSRSEAAGKEIDSAWELVKRRRIERARLMSERTALGNSWQRLARLRRENPRLYSDNLVTALDGRAPVLS